MMGELVERVWGDPRFVSVSDRLRVAWIAAEIGVQYPDTPTLTDLCKAIKAAAILACSDVPRHRRAAFRIATSAYELYGVADVPLDQAVRVVLARLGNFPSMLTRPGVGLARTLLPIGLLAEEIEASDRRTVWMGGEPTVLTDFQHQLWLRLLRRDRVALTAPTSAGKSFVLQRYIAAVFEAPGARSVMYLVPTRALITQVSQELRRGWVAASSDRLRPPEVVTVPVDKALVPPTRAVYVLTPERAHAMLGAHPGLRADVVVVDEAHLVADGARGVRLHGVLTDLLRREPGSQFLFAGPGVGNLDVFGRILGMPDVELVRSFEPTVAQNIVIVRVTDPDAGGISLRLQADRDRTLPVAEIVLRRRTVTRIEKLSNVAAALGGGATNLVYANGPADAEAIASALVRRLGPRPTTPERLELARVARESVHRDYALVDCARAGVAYHYSNMPAQLRVAVERAVAAGVVDYLVCTSTMLQGVNLPARNMFMFRPEKGQYVPLNGADFWNLAGRAGRLAKEFQGNIFLIDYDGWRLKPLTQPPLAPVVPAIDRGVMKTTGLLSTIRRPVGPSPDDPDMEAVFVSLLGDHREGKLPATLDRIARDQGIERWRTEAIAAAVSNASNLVRLPQRLLRKSPDVSAHKQQRLYDLLAARAAEEGGVATLVPLHPDEAEAYASYANTLRTCHSILLGLPRDSRLHRFLALVCLWWMRGRSLPRIVQNQLDRNPDRDKGRVMRETLELVERDVRYQCVRLFSCYSAVLGEVLHDLGHGEAAERVPELPLFLELGAADRTTISMMSLGLSRTTATRLRTAAPYVDMDAAAVALWLAAGPAILSNLSVAARAEIDEALRGKGTPKA